MIKSQGVKVNLITFHLNLILSRYTSSSLRLCLPLSYMTLFASYSTISAPFLFDIIRRSYVNYFFVYVCFVFSQYFSYLCKTYLSIHVGPIATQYFTPNIRGSLHATG